MNITVKARHMNVTSAIRDYAETKVAKLSRFYDGIASIQVILDIEADKSVAEIVVHARRKHTFVATERSDDMYAAIDRCIDKVAEQLRRHKDRIRDHHGPSSGEAAERTGP